MAEASYKVTKKTGVLEVLPWHIVHNYDIYRSGKKVGTGRAWQPYGVYYGFY